MYFNKTQGTPFYTPDLDRPAYRKEWLKSQAGAGDVAGVAEKQDQRLCRHPAVPVRGQATMRAPEAHTAWSFWPAGLYQVTWSSPMTSKVLLEAGVSLTQNGFPYTREQATDIFGFTVKPTDISILEASTGFRYNAKAQLLRPEPAGPLRGAVRRLLRHGLPCA